eukprot:TRINITY_DN73413_c0_g1_i1.p1 TRINITY_DN73413_c0_g1~~TRINITY_DN73413_c0_g1_i1.p1  ORF type:complete len:330 (+),score=67.52 TRINITY_DN73413_c0_g1_i1:127-1116(+)
MLAFGDDFEVQVVDLTLPSAPKQFTDSLKTTGFAVVTNHPLKCDLIRSVYKEWNGFMKELMMDDAKKDPALANKYKFDPAIQDGYFPMSTSETAKGATVKDLKHYFQLYFPHGRYPDEVSDDARNLAMQMQDFGKTLVQWIDDYMPERVRQKIHDKCGGPLVNEISRERTMFRILHYPAYESSQQEIGAVRAAAHEDINLITVLPAGSARGLQLLNNKTGKWYEVPCIEGSIVINIGDMLQELSDGVYKSTTHRVIKMDNDDSTGDRMSTPCFIHAKQDTPLSTRYPTAEDYLFERLKELGVKTDADKIEVKRRKVLRAKRSSRSRSPR